MNKYMWFGSLAACTSLKGTISNTFDRGCGPVAISSWAQVVRHGSIKHGASSIRMIRGNRSRALNRTADNISHCLTSRMQPHSARRSIHRPIRQLCHTRHRAQRYPLQLFWLDVLEQSPAASTNFITCSEKPLQFSQAVQWSCIRLS
jgi:hypothetical protein